MIIKITLLIVPFLLRGHILLGRDDFNFARVVLLELSVSVSVVYVSMEGEGEGEQMAPLGSGNEKKNLVEDPSFIFISLSNISTAAAAADR